MTRWAVVGLGRAGAARARAILATGDVVLAAVRGTPTPEVRTVVPSLGPLLPHVDAVAVCAPDETHADYVQMALEAGRHVVCEHPLAPTARDAARLYRLAGGPPRSPPRGPGGRSPLLLHVGHIGRLTPAARRLRQVAATERVRGVALTFHAHQGPRFLAGLAVAHRSVARLQRLLDLVGPVDRICVHDRGDQHLRCTLRGRGGVEASFTAVLDHPGPRSLRLEVRTATATWIEADGEVFCDGVPQALEAPRAPLFEQDQRLVRQRLDGVDPGPDALHEDRILAGLALADALTRAARGADLASDFHTSDGSTRRG